MTEFIWQPHYLFPKDINHAHSNGYSILRADSEDGRFTLGGSQYEVSPDPSGSGDIARFSTEEEVRQAIQ